MKQKHMTPAEVVHEHLGVRPLARNLKLSPAAVQRWKKTGEVPLAHWKKIEELSGGTITTKELAYGRTVIDDE